MRGIGGGCKWNLAAARFILFALASLAVASFAGVASAQQTAPAGQAAGGAQAAVAQSVGTVKAINGNVLTLTLDAGTDLTVNVTDTTRMVQVAPGQKDLRAAPAIHVADLQVGDRIIVRSRASDDAKSITALGIMAMKRTDVDAKKKQDLSDWQKSGVGGLVKAVDPAAGTITIAGPAVAGVAKTTVIHTTKATILRRYAPDSVKFDDAKPGPIDEVKPGDQLRARGEKSADGEEFAAAEIVSGTFRNIAGTIISVDVAAKIINVNDLIGKKAMVVKISNESQLKKLSPEMAQRIAMRFRGGGAEAAGGGAAGGGNGGAGNGGAGAGPGGASGDGTGPGAAGGAGGMQRGGGAGGGGGRADFQQLVNRLPAATITDFQKGDAVLVVSTQGTDTGGVTAITLLGGVEPMLAAAAGVSGQPVTLSPWALGGAPGGDLGGGVQ